MTPATKGVSGSHVKKRSILVIEEEKAVRDVLLAMLSRIGYQVAVASSGEGGLFFFLNGSFDLVLCDLTMPGMDGWTLARHIKDKSPDTPVCLMTGWGEEEIMPKLKQSAADSVMFKPFTFHKLQETVERMKRLRNAECGFRNENPQPATHNPNY